MIELKFWDHHRQSYHDTVPIREGDRIEGEILIGDYGKNGGVGEGGEFALLLVKAIGPRLSVFGDAIKSLQVFLANGGAEIVESQSTDHIEISRMLIKMGIEDISHSPLSKET